ncbi:MAG: DUF3892 domain-containing protein [Lachnospiraceae bacterium]|nr:DUF3892 domain-containing protein [Lachnospiraceae bacterium]
MNTERNDAGAQLAYAALDEVPTPAADAKTITAVVKSRGRIKGYQLSDGTIVSKEEGVIMAKEGQIKGVGVAHRKDTEYLKALPDENENNNLSSLPSVSAKVQEEP